VDNGFKKSKLWKPPRYKDTRVDEVFAAKKSKFKIASGKENAKVIMFFSHLEVVHITVVIIRIG